MSASEEQENDGEVDATVQWMKRERWKRHPAEERDQDYPRREAELQGKQRAWIA